VNRKDGRKLTSMTDNQNHKSSNNANQDAHRAKTPSLGKEQAELINKGQVVDSLALWFL
jgi:hypothetical protein